MPLSCAQKDLHLYHYSFGTKLLYCPCVINEDALNAFTQLVRISAGCSVKAAMLLLKRTSSIAFLSITLYILALPHDIFILGRILNFKVRNNFDSNHIQLLTRDE